MTAAIDASAFRGEPQEKGQRTLPFFIPQHRRACYEPLVLPVAAPPTQTHITTRIRQAGCPPISAVPVSTATPLMTLAAPPVYNAGCSKPAGFALAVRSRRRVTKKRFIAINNTA
jgi:hypothetical protein